MPPDSSKQEFWNGRYAAEKIPWDYRGIPPKVPAYLAQAQPGRVLIPGCGSAYEVAAFHAAGWAVTALDFSPAAIERARRILGPLGHLVMLADFFQHPFGEACFDVVYERTFLCALPPRLWPDYAARMRQLLRPGGRLVGFFLYGEEPQPPPYPITQARITELLEPAFTRTQSERVPNSLPIFAGKEEFWQEWTRQSA
jgi:thiopurine S-methyltransferase